MADLTRRTLMAGTLATRALLAGFDDAVRSFVDYFYELGSG